MFALFLPGAELAPHASLHPAVGPGRQMLFEALDELDACGDLLLLDRGYVGNTWLLVFELARRQFRTVLDCVARSLCRIQPERSYSQPQRVKPNQHLSCKVVKLRA